jgi:hypothetical protein
MLFTQANIHKFVFNECLIVFNFVSQTKAKRKAAYPKPSPPRAPLLLVRVP